VAFSADASGASLAVPVTYTFTPSASVGWHVIADLPQSTGVKVAITHNTGSTTVTINPSTSSSGQAFTTSASGVLMFSDPFSAGGIPLPPPPPPTPQPTASKCDLNGDGSVNALDIQYAVNQTLGISPCTTADVNLDGQCTVLDVQLVTNDFLGHGCNGGP
jgi:hypothetical protein